MEIPTWKQLEAENNKIRVEYARIAEMWRKEKAENQRLRELLEEVSENGWHPWT